MRFTTCRSIFAFAFANFLGGACVDVSGGAVEVSWKVFGPSGQECPDDPSRCEAARVTRVTIEATRLGDSPDAAAGAPIQRGFPCQDGTGSTKFDLPTGRYAVRLVIESDPGCGAGCRFETPPPVVKDVEYGKVAELGLQQILVTNVSSCP